MIWPDKIGNQWEHRKAKVEENNNDSQITWYTGSFFDVRHDSITMEIRVDEEDRLDYLTLIIGDSSISIDGDELDDMPFAKDIEPKIAPEYYGQAMTNLCRRIGLEEFSWYEFHRDSIEQRLLT